MKDDKIYIKYVIIFTNYKRANKLKEKRLLQS